MQGEKHFQPKLFTSFNMVDRIPADNFYRRLKEILDLRFLKKDTEHLYGACGQKSIDPVVFFKICLVAYLENIISDRKLIDHCSMRLDILYFIDHDIDDTLPWHSTISRTRQLYPEDLFEKLFDHILSLCIEKGMVAGHTQTLDSAFVKANASMDTLELKVPESSLKDHLRNVRTLSKADREDFNYKPYRRAKINKASPEQQNISASDRELKEIKSRNRKWSSDQNQRPGAGNEGAKYTSNKTHYSPTDPDARISVKPGKARKLNYLGQMAVDTAHHVITHMSADFADKKDNQCLPAVVKRLKQRLNKHGLFFHNLAADTAYSSGENYALLEEMNISAFIPAHGTYKGGPEGFTYVREGDYYLCPNNKKVTFRKVRVEKKNDIKKRIYLTTRKDCKDCPFKESCIGKSHERRIDITFYKDEYERAIARVNSKQGRYIKAKRQSTVEPVFGSLINHLGMRKVNTMGIRQANKQLMMAAITYNLKKYLKFTKRFVQIAAKEQENIFFYYRTCIPLILNFCKQFNFSLRKF